MALYGSLAYWEKRYKYKEEHYEWYLPYGAVRHLMTPSLLSPPDGVITSKPRRVIEVRDRHGNLVPRTVVDLNRRVLSSGKSFPTRDQCRVLIVGCGNSRFGEEMMLDGWSGGSIVNLDFSPVVIDQMKRRYKEFYDQINASRNRLSITVNPMEFICADATKNIPYADKSFDLVVIKGTFDSILCSSGSKANAKRMMAECCRVLRNEHGAMMVVTNGNPDNRIVFFENEGNEWWDGICVHTVPRPADKIQSNDASKDYYVYVSRKRPGFGKGGSSPGRLQVKQDQRVVSSDEENSLPPSKRGGTSPLNKASGSKASSVISAVGSAASRANFTTMLR